VSPLLESISNRTSRVAVMGLGYVGLPLATAFARAGFPTSGVDIDRSKIDRIRAGESYIPDVASNELKNYVESGHLLVTADYDTLCGVDVVFICVPTPYDAQRTPDLTYIRDASEAILPRLAAGMLVILQSTTYPGTTEEIVRPILERSGLRAGVDFHLVFAPERIDPGNREWSAHNTPKVVGGLTDTGAELAAALLQQMGTPVHIVSSPRAAELTKLLENTFRSVNIALVNELALLSERMGIDFWEVIAAAKTKPFGYMPFYPGPGVGGHCIPVDPYYLSWKAREYDYYTEFIELAGEVNQAMPYHVVDLVGQALSLRRKPVSGASVLVLGVAFKPGIDDMRNSPAIRVVELLANRGAAVRYHDPYVPDFRVGGDVFQREVLELESVPLTPKELSSADCVVIVTGHPSIDYDLVVDKADLIVDTCNATAASPLHLKAEHLQKIVRLGAPMPVAVT